MYTTCTFCYQSLGTNGLLESFPVARRVAFDPAKGCLWAVCPSCARWNLAPMEERWEAADECERRFRRTALRYSSGNIGLAWMGGDVELIRVGAALRPEVAAWRYGRLLHRPRALRTVLADRAARFAARGALVLLHARTRASRDPRAVASRMMAALRGNRVLDLVQLAEGGENEGIDTPLAVVRYRHLLHAALVRPEPGRPWSLHVPHDHGVLAVAGDRGVRLAARLLSVINGSERGGGFPRDLLEDAVQKVDDSAHPDSYFNRVLAIALRTRWGRDGEADTLGDRTLSAGALGERSGMDLAVVPDGDPATTTFDADMSQTERLAFALTGRTFWGNGGIGSEPSTALLDVPLVDRLALEMAAHEESERRALEGELAELADAWREADEIATIADALIPA